MPRTKQQVLIQRPVDEKVTPLAWTDYTAPNTNVAIGFDSTADAVKHLKANKVAGYFRVVAVRLDSKVNVEKIDKVTIG